ncbi:MAG: hypothetical protein Fur0046_28010 [Cyanobacteria bacterium J069]|nr:MAG: hypothetical protein D6742_06475 [Cyanobacteria bacterium J069]
MLRLLPASRLSFTIVQPGAALRFTIFNSGVNSGNSVYAEFMRMQRFVVWKLAQSQFWESWKYLIEFDRLDLIPHPSFEEHE